MTAIIGISTYHAHADWRGWSEEGALLPWTYVTSITGVGGTPVLLPPVGGAEEAEAAVARLDGVVIAGGGDIDPALYGASMHPETDVNAPDRDAWELAIAEAALRLRVPLLGVCRGMQVLNVACGGTLHQHVPDLVGHNNHSGTSEGFGVHTVRVTAGTQILDILPDGGQYFDVPTHHHQAVETLGDGLAAVAWAEDGIIEAIEGTNPHEFIVGVQWHPEQGTDPRLFRALVAAAETHTPAPALAPLLSLQAYGRLRRTVSAPQPPVIPSAGDDLGEDGGADACRLVVGRGYREDPVGGAGEDA